jgi:hypothetical protein
MTRSIHRRLLTIDEACSLIGCQAGEYGSLQ